MDREEGDAVERRPPGCAARVAVTRKTKKNERNTVSMKRSIVCTSILAVLAFASIALAADTPPEKSKVKPPEELNKKVSYMMGVEWGSQQQQFPVEIDFEMLLLGIKDGIAGVEPAFSQEQAEEIFKEFTTKVQADFEALNEKNQLEGLRFLEANKKNEGVIQTDSGLQYKVLQPGDGPKPTMKDQVKVQYRSTLLDGTDVGSSYETGEPFTFSLQEADPRLGVIKGWTEGIQLMNVGSKFRFWVRPQLAYDKKPPQGSPIEPGVTLIYDVELLSCEPAPTAKPEIVTPAPIPVK